MLDITPAWAVINFYYISGTFFYFFSLGHYYHLFYHPWWWYRQNCITIKLYSKHFSMVPCDAQIIWTSVVRAYYSDTLNNGLLNAISLIWNITSLHCSFKCKERMMSGGWREVKRGREREREMNKQGGWCVHFVLERCVGWTDRKMIKKTKKGKWLWRKLLKRLAHLSRIFF